MKFQLLIFGLAALWTANSMKVHDHKEAIHKTVSHKQEEEEEESS